MKVFITGATGFIGRRLVSLLVNKGIEVVALVRNTAHGLPDCVQVVYGDIMEPGSLATGGEGCSRLYHLAAKISFDTSKKQELAAVNGRGTENILKAAVRWRIPTAVIVSSACTIGIAHDKTHQLDESSIPAARLVQANPYLASKLETERTALSFSDALNTVIVNPSTVYGPGDHSLNSGTLIKTIAHARIIPVPPGGGNVIDVDDAAAGIIAAGEKGLSGRRYILGGENLLFSEQFRTIASVIGKDPLFITLPAPMRTPMTIGAWLYGKATGNRLITSQIIRDMFSFKFYTAGLARQELSWNPTYTFAQSVARAWDFYKTAKLI